MDAKQYMPGITPQHLINKLLTPVTSTKDYKFIWIFLACYRFFLPPSVLLNAIIESFCELGSSDRGIAYKEIKWLRYLIVIDTWLRNFPGDFALLPTYSRARNFINYIQEFRLLSVAARDLSFRIANVSEDDDTYWGFHDASGNKEIDYNRPTWEPAEKSDKKDAADIILHSRKFTIRECSPVELSCETRDKIADNYIQAQLGLDSLKPRPQLEFTKSHWRQVLNEPDDNIAKELTRIDWLLFSSFRPRDLIRHVSLAGNAKKLYRKLENVDLMVNHFNHVAYWVANLILIRDKAKHRALMMVKLMRIARVRIHSASHIICICLRLSFKEAPRA